MRDGRRSVPGVPDNLGEALADRGWIVVVPGHRLAPAAGVEEQLEDVAAAHAWVLAHAADLGGDPGRVVVGGHSSGAHLAALLATRGGPAPPPSGFLGLSGVYFPPDLARRHPELAATFRPAFGRDPESWVRSSPLTFASGRTPPSLLLVGSQEAGAVVEDSRHFAEALRLHGVAARLVVVPDRDHESLLVEVGSEGDPTIAEIVRFLEGLGR